MGKGYKVYKKKPMDKEKKKDKSKKSSNKPSVKLSKLNVIALLFLVVLEAIYYYFATPVLNIHVAGFWVLVIFNLLAICFCLMDFRMHKSKETFEIASIKSGKVFLIAAGVVFVGLAIMIIISSPVFMAQKYADIIVIEDGNFETDIVESENINNIALMDTDTARIIGERAIGSLSDVVSQYEVSDVYSTIDYNGEPMKVAPLEYAGFIKYLNNKKDGIPGYVMVDPVRNEAKYVELDKPIIYSPSASFNQNLNRHIQLQFPTYDFNGFYFELDNEGNPYYVCPVLKPNAGMFGAKTIKGVVLADPCTGESEYLELSEVPNWVDRVYDGDLAVQMYDWHGNLSGGFINSIIGNKGCKTTTEDYGYKVIDGDVWVYTGVTSVNGDESNIGFVLINLRTGASKYYSIAGAEEFSAMESAEGQVQNLGYEASFPSLININNIPTYIMVLKDNASLVKMYAIVNVEKYNIVATGSTQKEALTIYKKLLIENGISIDALGVTDETPSKRITVEEIKFINVEAETYVYITDKKGNVYKQNFSENEKLIFIQPEEVITVYYIEDETGINSLMDFE